MAKTKVRTTAAPAKHYPNDRHPNEIDPADVPETYASICKGDCLEPMFTDGACIVFSKTAKCEVGDFVAIWLHPEEVCEDELPRRVKRLAMALMPGMEFPYQMAPTSECEPLVVLEQLNPPKRYMIPGSRILAMHKVIGEAIHDGDGRARVHRQWIDGRMMRCVDED